MNRIWQGVLALLFAILIIEILIVSPEELTESKAPSTEIIENQFKSGEIEQVMRGVHLVESRESEKEWELWSEKAVSFKKTDLWALTTVKALFFGKDGVFFTVNGKEGEVEVKTKNMVVRGDVKIVSSNGYRFTTDEVSYDSVSRKLVAPNAVEMLGPKDANGHTLVLQGQSMKADLETSKMEVFQDVRGQKTFKNDKVVSIKSQKAVFSGKSNSAHFMDNVVIDMDTMRITGPDAVFNYNRKSKQVESVLVSGGVRVSDMDKWATSQKLDMHFNQDKLVFKGNPRVVQNNDELVGEKIVFLEGGKKVKVMRARAKVEKERMEKMN